MNWAEKYLIAEWQKAWKWFQVQLGALIVIAPELYNAFDQIQEVLPAAVFRHLMAVLGVLVVINSVRKKPE